jgi:hypothetical protein
MSVLPLAARGPAWIDGLRDCGLTLAAAGPQRWSVLLPEELVDTELRLVDGWLSFESAPPSGVERCSAWELLRANALLDGLAKFALGPGRARVLKAEVPAFDASDLPSRVRGICRGFARAGSVLTGPAGVRGDSLATSEPVLASPSLGGTLGALCAEAGWSFTERNPDRLMVGLDVPGVFLQASVAAHLGECRISVELARLGVLTALVRRALGYLLMNACGMVRFARATAAAFEDDRTSIGFEVRLELPLSAVELDHALSSLSAAARLCGREVNALCVERLATTYLNVHGPDRMRSGSLATVESNQGDCHGIQ